jgi:CheY-like chemotaxis protein
MKKILVVEDNLDIRENAVELLEFAGYIVIAAPDGKAGLEIARAEIPDIILSDIMMPHIGGHKLFEELRKDIITQKIPVIFMTSSVERKDIQSALDKGVNGYIKKPFEEDELLSTIRNCLM